MTQTAEKNDQLDRRLKIKVCGMTQPEQVRALVDLGVDAVGVILHADSARLISVAQAQKIRAEIPAFITLVGVFVDCDAAMVNAYSKQIGLDLVQLHGAENNAYGMALQTPFIKAIRAKSAEQVVIDIVRYPDARALLLDPYVRGQHGGTGQQLSADLWPSNADLSIRHKKLILAGGLSAQNVRSLVQRYQPYAIDLNSGVEDAPGIKNIDQVKACFRLVGR